MYSPITLDALRTLDAIERRRSFAAAADELFRVPSAVSYTVSKLEEDLGVTLFDRSRRKAELTPVGRLILDQGRQILMATEELDIEFTEEGISRIAEIAYQVNEGTENIGARRLHTVMERLLEGISFEASDMTEKVVIDADYVNGQLSDLAMDEDLSRFIL